jgi:hypothetical protein
LTSKTGGGYIAILQYRNTTNDEKFYQGYEGPLGSEPGENHQNAAGKVAVRL